MHTRGQSSSREEMPVTQEVFRIQISGLWSQWQQMKNSNPMYLLWCLESVSAKISRSQIIGLHVLNHVIGKIRFQFCKIIIHLLLPQNYSENLQVVRFFKRRFGILSTKPWSTSNSSFTWIRKNVQSYYTWLERRHIFCHQGASTFLEFDNISTSPTPERTWSTSHRMRRHRYPAGERLRPFW